MIYPIQYLQSIIIIIIIIIIIQIQMIFVSHLYDQFYYHYHYLLLLYQNLQDNTCVTQKLYYYYYYYYHYCNYYFQFNLLQFHIKFILQIVSAGDILASIVPNVLLFLRTLQYHPTQNIKSLLKHLPSNTVTSILHNVPIETLIMTTHNPRLTIYYTTQLVPLTFPLASTLLPVCFQRQDINTIDTSGK